LLRLVDFLLDFFAEALRLTVERELFRADFFAADFFADFLAATISPYCLPFFILFDFCICLNLLLSLAIYCYLLLSLARVLTGYKPIGERLPQSADL
jgi:hypothetical protein